MKQLFTSESVSPGHPDKICDQISDAILDACLSVDAKARVACECMITTNYLLIAGEITVSHPVDYEAIARNVLIEIGYDDDALGMNGHTCQIDVRIEQQSQDIAMGVDHDPAFGAGDQGIMFGYATNETPQMMPLTIAMAHDLVELATQLKKSGQFKQARPDMKSQVTIDLETGRLHTILMSIQHEPDIDESAFKAYVFEHIMLPIANKYHLNTDFEVLINPTGRFVIGGPHGDTGLTGRKIIVDTYGGAARHGGGAFSGKDGTKVDRSGAYMARYIAKQIVAAKIADRAEIQLSYAIGQAKPVSVFVETFNTSYYPNLDIGAMILSLFDLTPKGMIETLNLDKPLYKNTSVYGHFGKKELPWESLNDMKAIQAYLENLS